MSNSEELRWGIPPGETRSSIQTFTPTSERIPWGVARVGGDKLKPITSKRRIRVAVLDTGCDTDHPDLRGVVVRSMDFTGSRHGPKDVQGHGTHVAGTIAARRDNDSGLIGVSDDVEIYSYKVLDDSGSGTDTQIQRGMERAMVDDCDIFNFSLGGPSPMPGLERLIQLATSQDRIVVCAAGNDGPRSGRSIFPARYSSTVSVSSHGPNLVPSPFSNADPALDFCAPGENIESTFHGSRYTTMSGTSMAAPHVSAYLARCMRVVMVDDIRPPMSTVIQLAITGADQLGHSPNRVGVGLIKFTETMIEGGAPTPPPPPPPSDHVPVTIRIPIGGVNAELDDAFKLAGITSASLSFVIRK